MQKTVVYRAIRVWTCLLSIISFIEGNPISNWNSDLTYKGASVELIVQSCAVFFFCLHVVMSGICVLHCLMFSDQWAPGCVAG